MTTARSLIYKAFSALGSSEVRALERDCRQPYKSQEQKLLEIIRTNIDTDFSRQHSLAKVANVKDFQKSVPIRDYEGFRPYIERMTAGAANVLTAERPFMFATTSGTTGSPKYIPITEAYLGEFRRASVASGYNVFANFPAVHQGVTLTVVSPAEEGRTFGGIPFGAISGGLFLREPPIFRQHVSPIPYEVFLIKDYETRYYVLLRLALILPITTFYTLNPSTIVVLVKRLQRYAERLIADIAAGTITPPGQLDADVMAAIAPFLIQDTAARAAELLALQEAGRFFPYKIWPMLQVVCCWTRAAAAFYVADFPQYFGSLPVVDITYGASEGRGTVFLAPGKQLLAIRSHFFEFVPEEQMESLYPDVLTCDQVEVGKRYFILFTTSGGLYRYHINDVVKIVGFHHGTPLLEFQHKGGNISSFTGEKLTESQITAAMSATLAQLQLPCRFFTVMPQFKPEPHYQVVLEPDYESQAMPADMESNLACLPEVFDCRLGLQNIEYKTKRDSLRLGPVTVQVLEAGTYERLRKLLASSGVHDSQIKISHLNPKEDVRDFLAQHYR